MEKDVKGMKKDSFLDGQENSEALDTSFNGAGDLSGGEDWDINIDELLEQADMLVNNDMLPPMPEFEGENKNRAIANGAAAKAKQEPSAEPKAEAVAVAASEPNTEMDSELDEINSLLEQASLNEKVDEDMLALLESATENQEEEDNPDEVFDIFEDGDMPLGDMKSSGVPEETEEKEETGKKKKRNKKEKKKKSKEASDKDNESKKKEKKPGLLAKIAALLGAGDDLEEEEPDTAADENVKILNELNGEEGKKPSKKSKKKKGKEEKQNKKDAKAKAKPKANAKQKEKKAKTAKKKEKPLKQETEKSVKILDGKSFTAIVGLCLSIIAGVMIVTTFLPEYADKQTARKAFQDRDYETVYTLFYDKKLSADETLLFNQSKVIRQMERRLEAYQNNIALGRELEAVDALMRGVENYQNLWEADEYQVRNEVDALYGQICGILESNYGIDREEAVAIASYDKIEYTKALYTILGGDEISFKSEGSNVVGEEVTSERENTDGDTVLGDEEALPSEEGASNDAIPEDMLPAEEDLMN